MSSSQAFATTIRAPDRGSSNDWSRLCCFVVEAKILQNANDWIESGFKASQWKNLEYISIGESKIKSAKINVGSKSVQSLIQLGYCQASDIKQAKIDGERLSSQEYAAKIRQLEMQLKMLGESNRIKILSSCFPREKCASASWSRL